MRKRIISLISLLLIAALLLTACSGGAVKDGEKDEENEKESEVIENDGRKEGEDEKEEETLPDTEENPSDEPSGDEAEDGNETTDEGAENAPEDEQADSTADVRGEISGSAYRNEFFGFGTDLDDSWYIADEDTLAGLAGRTGEFLGDPEAVQSQLREGGTIYDLYAETLDGLVNITVTVSDMGAVYGSVFSETDLAEYTKDAAAGQLESMGVSAVYCETEEVSFAGGTHSAVRMTSEMEITEETSITIYQLLIIVKNGQYISSITITTVNDDYTDSLAGGFYAVA